MRLLLLLAVFIFMAAEPADAQVSQGGWPLEIPALRARGVPEMRMPRVNNKMLQQKAMEREAQNGRHKSLEFAHGFEVNFSPATDGLWINNIQGYDVWQIKIRSEGAYSIHLVFDKFHLSKGSRLFIISQTTGHTLGAFTSANNKATNNFATAPVAGDELTVQFEVPAGQDGTNDFEISIVNHDYIGILKYNDRQPTKERAGSCNIDINCLEGEPLMDERDAVCRIITSKRIGTRTFSEVCTGVLINNTAEDQKPYIMTAAHCIEEARFAETSVFTFNYQSPYCAPLFGDPGNSISGSVLRALSDSLDFALVELSLIPPPDYRPFFAGWENQLNLPSSTASIHHPQGDVKKIAVDMDAPSISNFGKDYTPSGFLQVKRWEAGVTEAGSSGAPLFNQNKRLTGTLTGGNAKCDSPVEDYFARFDLAWEYKSDPSGQLKYWLDPLNTNTRSLTGKRFYSGEEFCMAFTNLEHYDEHQNVVLEEAGQQAGYWGGTNSLNITAIAEKFTVPGDEQLFGVSIGVGWIQLVNPLGNSEITVKVFDGNFAPETLIYSKKVPVRSMVADAMNFIQFDRIVEPSDTFFIAIELTSLHPQDEFVVYQSLRQPGRENFFWFQRNNVWYDFRQVNREGFSLTNVIELVACNVNAPSTDRPLVEGLMESMIYPNPTQGLFTFETGQEIFQDAVKVYNLLGKEVNAKFYQFREKKIEIDLSGNMPGVYFVRFNSKHGRISGKVIYNPR